MPKFISDVEMEELEKSAPKKTFISDEEMAKIEQPAQSNIAGDIQELASSSAAQAITKGLAKGATFGADNALIAAASAAAHPIAADTEHQAFVEKSADELEKKQDAAIQKIEAKLATTSEPTKIDQLTSMLNDLKSLRETPVKPDSGFVDRYYGLKKQLSEQDKQLEAEHPGTMLAAELVGGLGTMGIGNIARGTEAVSTLGRLAQKALPSTKSLAPTATTKFGQAVERIGGGIAEGTKFGAITGATGEGAELLRGDVSETAEEAAGSAALAGLAGGVIGGGIEATKGALKLIPGVERFQSGREFARQTATPEYAEMMNRRLPEGAEKIKPGVGRVISPEEVYDFEPLTAEKILNLKSTSHSKVNEALRAERQLAAEKGKVVDDETIINLAKQKVQARHAGSEAEADAKAAELSFLESLLGKSKVQQRAETEADKALIKAEHMGGEIPNKEIIAEAGEPVVTKLGTEEGKDVVKVGKIIPEYTGATAIDTPQKANEFAQQIWQQYEKIAANPEKADAAKSLKALWQDVRNSINKAVGTGEYNELSKKSETWFNIADKIGIKPYEKKFQQAEAVQSLIGTTAKGDEKRQIYNMLRESGQHNEAEEFKRLYEMSADFRKTVGELEKETSLANPRAIGLLQEMVIGAKRKMGAAGSMYEIGKQTAGQRMQDFIKSGTMGRIIKGTADEFSSIGDRLISIDPKFATYGKAIKDLATKSESHRAAMLYGLYQQPGFREMINTHVPELTEESEQ